MSITLHTTLGDIKIEVFCEAVPKTAENFLALCASSFYNNTPFHRVLPTFIIQTGSPASDPRSKASSSIYNDGGLFPDEIRPSLRHNARGIISMANKGPDTNGSQFFICLAAQPQLDGKNTVFARVIDGEDILDKIEGLSVDAKGRVKGAEVPRINTITIHANPLAG